MSDIFGICTVVQTYKSIWNAYIALLTRLHLYNSCILLIIFYAFEYWAPTKAEVARFRCFLSVVSSMSTQNYLEGPHQQHRGLRIHWSTSAYFQRDHI